MIDVEVSPFEERHAGVQVDLEARAFARVSASARPKDSAEYLAHIHGPKNPAGCAWIAVATEAGRPLGSAAALPALFARKSGRILTGWQIGTFVVDAEQQGKGIGTALLEALTDALKGREGAFLYSYPNRRSIGVFERHGYARAGRTPTRIFLPARGPGEGFETRKIAREELPSVLASIQALPPTAGGFLRDARTFAWRFGAQEAEGRYRFVRCGERDGAGAFVVALAAHRFAGLHFGVLAGACPDVLEHHLGTAVRAALAHGSSLLYATVTARPGSELPWSLTVPESRDPRPVVRVLHAGTAPDLFDEVAASSVMTSDWGGF